jgi:hypothetical protein
MALTYEPIATTTLGAVSNQITFNSIPQTYTDLRVVWVGRTDSAVSGGDKGVRFNGDAGSFYSEAAIYGEGTTAGTSKYYNNSRFYLNYWGSTFHAHRQLYTLDIFSYTNTAVHKSVLISMSQDLNGSGRIERHASIYGATAAITSLSFINISGDGYAAGTTVTIYGIKAA